MSPVTLSSTLPTRSPSSHIVIHIAINFHRVEVLPWIFPSVLHIAIHLGILMTWD